MAIESDLFDNPYFNEAYVNLSDEDKRRYEKRGEDMYNTVDFTDSTIINSEVESVAYLTELIKCGYHPSELSESDVTVLKNYFGNEWYLRFGYEADCTSNSDAIPNKIFDLWPDC